jgi:hypothetical protein
MAAIKLVKSSDAKKGRTFDNEPVLQSGWGKTSDDDNCTSKFFMVHLPKLISFNLSQLLALF